MTTPNRERHRPVSTPRTDCSAARGALLDGARDAQKLRLCSIKAISRPSQKRPDFE